MRPYLAHGARARTANRPAANAQMYEAHICNVRNLALKMADDMLAWYTGPEERKQTMRRVIENASIFHDLGKLHRVFQDFLYGVEGAFNINHVDGGVMVLMKLYMETGDKTFLFSAILVESHHIGIFNGTPERGYQQMKVVIRKNDTFLRDMRSFGQAYDRSCGKRYDLKRYYPEIDLNERICDNLNSQQDFLLRTHLDITNLRPVLSPDRFLGDFSPLELRLMGACLYFADHTDTAICSGGYGLSQDEERYPLRAKERIASLDAYVSELETYSRKLKKDGTTRKDKKAGKATKRNKVRHMLYNNCKRAIIKSHFYLNDGYVGIGKTLSNKRLSLRIAATVGSRGVMSVATYTAIVSQNAKELTYGREGSLKPPLILDDEFGKETRIIAEHHHKNDYDGNQIVKAYNVTWTSPIVFTTSVQMVESLASNQTVATKKLINLPGRVIILDEFDNSMPLWEWAIFGSWLKELADNWSCYFIFSSGSSVSFWNIKSLNIPEITPVNVLSGRTRRAMQRVEKRRISYDYIGVTSLEKLIGIKDIQNDKVEWENGLIDKYAGPISITLNTVQNWAIVSHFLGLKYGEDSVITLSTAFDVKLQKSIIEKVSEKLKNKSDKKWFFVTTSSAESGINFSFRNGFRECNSVKSTLQPGGRINRDSKNRGGKLVVFEFSKHKWLTRNPEFNESSRILQDLFAEKGNDIGPEDSTDAIDKELRSATIGVDAESNINKVKEAEQYLQMRTIRELMKVIDQHAVTVLSDADIFTVLARGDIANMKISDIYKQLMENSFTVFWGKMSRIGFETIKLSDVVLEDHFTYEKLDKFDGDEIAIWAGGYDNKLLGYMSEILYQMNLMGAGIPGVKRGAMCADPIRREFWKELGIEEPKAVLRTVDYTVNKPF